MNDLQIKNMLNQLVIVGEGVISRYEYADGYNYANDHSPIDVNEAVKKVQRFIGFGGKVKQFSDPNGRRIQREN